MAGGNEVSIRTSAEKVLVSAQQSSRRLPILTRRRKESAIIAVALGLYLGATAIFVILQSGAGVVDVLIPVGFFFALVLGRGHAFVVDWLPFVVILRGYEEARALAYRVGEKVHIVDIIALERRLMGNPIPSERLEAWLYRPGSVMPWDLVASAAYLLHFVIPIGFCGWLWLKSRRLFWRHTLALIALSYAAFATYVVFPEMPPWLASQDGYLPPIPRIFQITLQHVVGGVWILRLATRIDPNPVAAMPSLHVAYPVITYLTTLRVWRSRWAHLVVFYPAIVIFSVVYLGEHYVLDTIAGAGYALVASWMVWDAPSFAQGARKNLIGHFHQSIVPDRAQ